MKSTRSRPPAHGLIAARFGMTGGAQLVAMITWIGRHIHSATALVVAMCWCFAIASCDGRSKSTAECKVQPEDDDNYCGCARVPCQVGTKCFQGHCCQPTLVGEGLTDPARCGCQFVCEPGVLCINSQCCDPTTASSQSNCGCEEDCSVRGPSFLCTQDATTLKYACTWTAGYDDPNNCGAQGNVCAPHEHCSQGECKCNPADTYYAYNNENCGCTGISCPLDAHCSNATCVCFDANKVFCEGVCVKQDDCFCDKAKHQNDTLDCNCTGPCAGGNRCENGACVCDDAQHSTNSQQCGCPPVACNTLNGEICSGGACVCPPQYASDNINCGCSGNSCDVAYGWNCDGGICACAPQANAANNLNCGCTGTMCNTQIGETCIGGVCACSTSHLTDPENCGCPGVTCQTEYGETCVGGVCTCGPGCGKCIDLPDLTLFPLNHVGGDTEFNGHGPFVTVQIVISNPQDGILSVEACINMIETEPNWTEGDLCVTELVPYAGGDIVGPKDFLVKYTDNNHAWDDAMSKASSLVQNPAVLGVTCQGDLDNSNDLCCAGCWVQMGCLMVNPSP